MERKLPDITRTSLGKDVVDVLAFGSMQYMIDNDIPLTEQGFEAFVGRSRETGLNGRIAFQVYDWTQSRLQKLFAESRGLPVKDAPDVARRLRGRPSARSRLLSIGLDPNDTTLTEEQKQCLLERIQEELGPEVADIIEALRHGECQRDLVWKRINEILHAGDHLQKLDDFRTKEA